MKCNSLEEASSFKKSEDGVKAPKRVEAVIQKVREKAAEYGADSDMVEVLYREMISKFVSMETVMNDSRDIKHGQRTNH